VYVFCFYELSLGLGEKMKKKEEEEGREKKLDKKQYQKNCTKKHKLLNSKNVLCPLL